MGGRIRLLLSTVLDAEEDMLTMNVEVDVIRDGETAPAELCFPR